MNILVLTSVYKDYSLGNKDKSTNIVNSFVKEWTKAGHKVIVIHNSHRYPKIIHKIPLSIRVKLATKLNFQIPDYEDATDKRYEQDGAKVYRLAILKLIPHRPPFNFSINKQTSKIKKILDNNSFTPNIITGHWVSPQAEIIHNLKKIYMDSKTAIVLHGTGYIDKRASKLKRIIKTIDHIGCRSESQSKQVKQLLGLDYAPFVCESGIPDEYLMKYKLNTNKQENVKKWQISCIGRLLSYKNFDKVIMALSEIDHKLWKLNIAGEGAEKNRLMRLAKKLKCEKNVIFYGKIPREKVMQLLKKTNIYAMISDNEVFGLVYLEAMSASCITIASKDGGVDGIINDKKNGYLCEQGNWRQLNLILSSIMHSSDNYKIAKEAYLTAQQYSDSKMAQKYINEILKQ